MKKSNLVLLLALLCINVLSAQQKKYPQPLTNDICTKIVVTNFICKGCATSDKDLPNDIREDVIEIFNSFKYCSLLSRDKLSEIIKTGSEEEGIASLNAQQRTQLKDYYQAERILFGNLKIQSNGSVLVTLEIDNLTTTDQEGYKRFTIPADKFSDYESRHPVVEQAIVSMLLGSTETTATQSPAGGQPPSGTPAEKPGSNPPPAVSGPSANIIWIHTSGEPAIWKIDADGNFLKDKVHANVTGWTLVNCFKNKVLWRHTSGKISIWTIDADGNVTKFKEHGPIAGWTAVSYSDNRLLWRHTSGKISLWAVDDDGNQTHYKEHGPYQGWTALFHAKDNIVWKHTNGAVSIWKMDYNCNQLSYKESAPIPDWTLVNCFNDKVLWRHTSGKISLWSVDAQGNVFKYKEHGPIAGWTAVCYSEGKILWRHTTGKVSLWTVDDTGNQLSYKEYDAIDGWTPLFFMNKQAN